MTATRGRVIFFLDLYTMFGSYPDDFGPPPRVGFREEQIKEMKEEWKRASKEDKRKVEALRFPKDWNKKDYTPDPKKQAVKQPTKQPDQGPANNFPLYFRYTGKSSKKVPALDWNLNPIAQDQQFREVCYKLNAGLTIFVTPSLSFVSRTRKVFTDARLTFTQRDPAIAWPAGPNMRFWPQQLNFAVFCATAGCGVGKAHVDPGAAIPGMTPQIRSIYAFHIYYTTRRILSEMQAALPGDSAFNPMKNPYSKSAYSRLCAEFKIPENTDFRYKRGPNGGIGTVNLLNTKENKRHAGMQTELLKANFKQWPMSPEFDRNNTHHSYSHLFGFEGDNAYVQIHNIETEFQSSWQYEYFVLVRSKGLTQAGLTRLGQSIQALVYCALNAQLNTKSPLIGITSSAGLARQEFSRILEDELLDERIGITVAKYNAVIRNSHARLDLAIAKDVWLMPSDLTLKQLKGGAFENATNRSNTQTHPDIMFGVNDKINLARSPPPAPPSEPKQEVESKLPAKTPESKQQPVKKPGPTPHEIAEEKTVKYLVIGGVVGLLAILAWRET